MSSLPNPFANQIGSTFSADAPALSPHEESLDWVLEAVQQQLMTFATSEDAIAGGMAKPNAQLTAIFDNAAKNPALETTLQLWRNNDFSQMPNLVVLADADMNGAQGGFSAATQTIYLSGSLVQHDPLVGAVGVVIEEMGHSLDTLLHPNGGDTQGDEGELFKATVLGTKLSQAEQFDIRQEDDRGWVRVDGEAIAIEQATAIQKAVVSGHRVDFNGDGRTDFLRQEKGGWDNDSIITANVFLSLGNGTFTQVNLPESFNLNADHGVNIYTDNQY
ncbi:MAG: hypothetical protein VKJ64_17185 [Leptolyngbyaceae bacterium]|nr:hypothetical protein [Leptolyngbyaceae bacterium]